MAVLAQSGKAAVEGMAVDVAVDGESRVAGVCSENLGGASGGGEEHRRGLHLVEGGDEGACERGLTCACISGEDKRRVGRGAIRRRLGYKRRTKTSESLDNEALLPVWGIVEMPEYVFDH